MALLKKDDFLAWGLEPMPNLESQAECFCNEDAYTRPVRTTCGHTYCTGCLTRWLKHKNTCPMCRQQLFETESDEDDDDDEYDGQNEEERPGQGLYIHGVRWPRGIEPFDLWTDLRISYSGPHDMLDYIEEFDRYRRQIQAFGTHPLIDRTPVQHEVHVQVDHLFSQAAGCVYRLASNPDLDNSDAHEVRIHQMCREEWMALLRNLKETFVAIAGREEERRALQWPGPNASDLYLELGYRLLEFPRADTFAGTASARRNEEVKRFRSSVDELVRWLVTQAFRENWMRVHDPDYEEGPPQNWWIGLADYMR